MWFVFHRSALFSGKKKTRKLILGFGRSKSQEINLKISTINLHRAGKLKRGEKYRNFLLTEQVFFIN